MEGNQALNNFKVGSLPTVIYIPDFITKNEETLLLKNIYDAPVSKWKSLKNRRLQNWGGVVHEKGLISQDSSMQEPRLFKVEKGMKLEVPDLYSAMFPFFYIE